MYDSESELFTMITGQSPTHEKWSSHVSQTAEGIRQKRSRALVLAGVEGGVGLGWGGGGSGDLPGKIF